MSEKELHKEQLAQLAGMFMDVRSKSLAYDIDDSVYLIAVTTELATLLHAMSILHHVPVDEMVAEVVSCVRDMLEIAARETNPQELEIEVNKIVAKAVSREQS